MAILGIFLAVNHKVIPEYPTASNATGIRPCRWAPPAGYTPPNSHLIFALDYGRATDPICSPLRYLCSQQLVLNNIWRPFLLTAALAYPRSSA